MAVVPLIGLAITAASAAYAGISSANAASYQGQIAKNAAVVASQKEAYSASAAATDAEQAGLKARAQGSTLRAAIGANDLDVNSGSPSTVQQSQSEIGQLNTLNTANNDALNSYGYQTEAINEQAQQGLYEGEATSDEIGGGLGALGSAAGNSQFTSLLNGNPSVPSAYQWMQSQPGGSPIPW